MASTQGNEPAYPVEVAAGDNGWREHQTGPSTFMTAGLTKRELFAAMAMQGHCANQEMSGLIARSIATMSVEQADALLAELAKEAA